MDLPISESLRIAVVGGGVSGITAAHILQRRHRVTLFEKNASIGGHTHTIVLDSGPDVGTAVDTGFIVMNDRTYPLFHRFLEQLQVPFRSSDMSFGFYCESTGFSYSGRGFNGLFADRWNLFRVAHWEMIRDVVRFNRHAPTDLHSGKAKDLTLGDYLSRHRYSTSFLQHYLLPMGAAIWSTRTTEMMRFPAETFLRFFDHHGLLTLTAKPQWQTISGGSHTYLRAFLNRFSGKVLTACPVHRIEREQGRVTVYCKHQEPQHFDRIVIGVHADQVLPLLADPTEEETRLFSCWEYNQNHTVLHTDPTVMPPNRRAWASWNYTREKAGEHPLSLTYDMNRLQGLNTQKRYFVTLNRKKPIHPEAVIREFQYTHPRFTQKAVATQEEFKQLYGKNNTYYCGSYFGYGFHEDAVKSGVRAAQAMGMDL